MPSSSPLLITCTPPSPWPLWNSANMSTSRSLFAGRSKKRVSFRAARRKPKSSRRWATRVTLRTKDAPRSNTFGLAPSATCAKSTSGRIAHSAFGLRASRAARGAMPPVKLTWYDGGLKPNKPEELGDEELNKEGGALLIGSKGKLLYDTYGFKPRLLPKSLHESFGKPTQKLPRIAGQFHEMNWVDACKGKVEASCPFEYAARLTEVMLLGIVALRAGRKIYY